MVVVSIFFRFVYSYCSSARLVTVVNVPLIIVLMGFLSFLTKIVAAIFFNTQLSRTKNNVVCILCYQLELTRATYHYEKNKV
jgi:hypothetical protein